mgnify:CR=1 FL=1
MKRIYRDSKGRFRKSNVMDLLISYQVLYDIMYLKLEQLLLKNLKENGRKN